MDGIKFNSLSDLYKRLLPALRSKTKELIRNNILYIHEEDIWNYLKDTKWLESNNLTLADMVSDIFDIDPYILEEHFKKSIENDRREIITDSGSIL